MVDPQKVDFNQMPKKFCDGAIGAFNKDTFFLALTSGNNLDAFATTPKLLKDISIFLNKNVENYEKQFGVIDMSLPQIISPFQTSNLDGDKK
jgi:hypothetical protein